MYHIIANPISGRGKSNVAALKVKEYLDNHKISYKWYSTEYKGHPKILAVEIDNENPNGGIIIVIGGDGTLNEVVNGLKDLLNWNIGLIPAGSGNDLASKLNLKPKDPIYNLELILNGTPRAIDFIQINQYRCLNIAGSGIDVDILKRFEKYTCLKGKFRYLVALVVTLCVFKWYKFKISVDDQPFENKTGFITTICNGSSFGGGIKICPDSIVDDNELDYVFVNKVNRLTIPFYLVQLLRGKLIKYKKKVEWKHCQKITFASDKNFSLNIDGEIVEDKEFVCSIVKNGFKIYY